MQHRAAWRSFTGTGQKLVRDGEVYTTELLWYSCDREEKKEEAVGKPAVPRQGDGRMVTSNIQHDKSSFSGVRGSSFFSLASLSKC